MTLPNFVIPGAMKAGTSSLYNYLRQHPQIYMSRFKETRFFAYDPNDPVHLNQSYRSFPVRTMDEYLDQFSGVENELAIGEASPRYLVSPIAPANIKRLIPDIRLVLSLRHPVARMYSVYLMNYLSGLNREDVRKVCRPGGNLSVRMLYSPDVRRWLAHFDRSQFHIMLLEDLRAAPLEVIQSIYRFLDVDDGFVPDTSSRYNVGGVAKNKVAGNLIQSIRSLGSNKTVRQLKPHMPRFLRSWRTALIRSSMQKPPALPEDLASELELFYTDDVAELQDLLDIDLSVWGLTRDSQKVAG